MKRNEMNKIIKTLGKIYISSDKNEMNRLVTELNNTYKLMNEKSKQILIENIVNELYFHKVLEVTKFNLTNLCNTNEFVLNLRKQIDIYINTKIEKVYNEHLNLLLKLSTSTDIMLIKGMAIKNFYPENYVRNQGDIDILVRDFDSLWKIINNLSKKYYFEKFKLHFLYDNQTTGTIDLIPYNKQNPYIDIHLTPYYMWGAISYPSKIWKNSKKYDTFYVPDVEDLVLMLCAHISNQWLYRMRDINDLFCIITKNRLDWNKIIFKSKELGIFSILKILLINLYEVYNSDILCYELPNFNNIKMSELKEKLFNYYNFGKENTISSLPLELFFTYQNYNKHFSFYKSIKHCIKNSYYMVATNNRAFNTKNILKRKKENEVYVLKTNRKQANLKMENERVLREGLILYNENSKFEYFRMNNQNWYQVPYKD